MFNSSDFRTYRLGLGFSSQGRFKEFLSAKDIEPSIDFGYIDALNLRLCEIFKKINLSFYLPCDIEPFLEQNLIATFNKINQNGILFRLNNQGRRKEEVYFSWMRGFLICEYFKPAICDIFGVKLSDIKNIGDDDFSEIDRFKRTPRADLQIANTRIEVQSGFQGINDIKEHKVREARLRLANDGLKTLVLHFDIFNGQVAMVDISSIDDGDLNWITRQQMEGQSVFNIDQNYFLWLLNNKPPRIKLD